MKMFRAGLMYQSPKNYAGEQIPSFEMANIVFPKKECGTSGLNYLLSNRVNGTETSAETKRRKYAI